MKTGQSTDIEQQAVALQVKGLTKKYGGYTVLDGIDLQLPRASLVGLLGPNGAGKTTFIKIACGLITPDEGEIHIAGHDLRKEEVAARGSLAYVPDVPSLYPELTIWEHLELHARAHGTSDTFPSRAETLLRRFGLWEARDNPTYTLSRGMMQKLALCGAFVRPSQVMLMDEPAGSLDIASVSELYDMLEEYREDGGLAVVSSHQWEDLQDLCDSFVLMVQGEAVMGDLPLLRIAASLPKDASLREVYMAFMHAGRQPEDIAHRRSKVAHNGQGR